MRCYWMVFSSTPTSCSSTAGPAHCLTRMIQAALCAYHSGAIEFEVSIDSSTSSSCASALKSSAEVTMFFHFCCVDAHDFFTAFHGIRSSSPSNRRRAELTASSMGSRVGPNLYALCALRCTLLCELAVNTRSRFRTTTFRAGQGRAAKTNPAPCEARPSARRTHQPGMQSVRPVSGCHPWAVARGT